MARISPFCGLRYNPLKIQDIKSVVTPPYDVISKTQLGTFYKSSRYNFIRVILGREDKSDTAKDNRYTRAKSCFERWLKQEILIKDNEPSVYVYEQSFNLTGRQYSRLGFIALLKIEPSGSGVVFPHEKTFCKPKKDRLSLIRATQANLSPIFGLYSDPGFRIDKLLSPARAWVAASDFRFEGVRNRLWKISDRNVIRRLEKLMRDKEIYIADGHHRYEVACIYNKLMKKAKGLRSDYVMMYFSNLASGSLKVLPTHRVIGAISKERLKKIPYLFEECFKVVSFSSGRQLFRMLKTSKNGEHLFGVYTGKNRFYLLSLRKAFSSSRSSCASYHYHSLDVVILHNLILGKLLNFKDSKKDAADILYTRDERLAMELVDSNKYKIAFFMNPPQPAQIRAIASASQKMPHKSTYFYPKPLSGLVINSLKV